MNGNLVLQRVKTIGEAVREREIGVDHGVQDDICQVIGTRRPNICTMCLQTLAEGPKRVPRSFLKGQHIVRTDKHADLLRVHDLAPFGQSSDDEQVLRVRFDLRPLMDMNDILQGQGVQMK